MTSGIKLTFEQAAIAHNVLQAALKFKSDDVVTLRRAGLNALAAKVERLVKSLEGKS